MEKPDGLDAATTMQAMQHHTDGCLIVFCACQVHTEGTGASLSVGGAPFPVSVCEVKLTRPLQDKMLFPKARRITELKRLWTQLVPEDTPAAATREMWARLHGQVLPDEPSFALQREVFLQIRWNLLLIHGKTKRTYNLQLQNLLLQLQR